MLKKNLISAHLFSLLIVYLIELMAHDIKYLVEVLRISSDRDDQGIFWSLKFFISGVLWVGKVWQVQVYFIG